ncbi:hypothetical protein CEXT_336581 [Caerostris extrusa]|uniref:Uncharacterized protein n=1 Tax=Caerostris extrusa TaxID=172846 RepID=A0AAV4Y125_CAEEX|nr:hypothetical protein CEXT_336581 [Caerostris extrusa]
MDSAKWNATDSPQNKINPTQSKFASIYLFIVLLRCGDSKIALGSMPSRRQLIGGRIRISISLLLTRQGTKKVSIISLINKVINKDYAHLTHATTPHIMAFAEI